MQNFALRLKCGEVDAGFGMSDFAIYSLDAGKGLLALSPCPGLTGDYELDADQIQAWRPSFVLTMTPLAELEQLGAAKFMADVPTFGARWLHFPVKDFGSPDATQTQAWTEISEKIRKALLGGGRVLVHCRGGCGRSGMAVLRLLIEMGEPVSDALTRLRYVRHCAVETDAQFDWAVAGQSEGVGEDPPSSSGV